MVMGRYLFYFAVLIFENGLSLSHNNDLNYYDGSRGRMNRNYYTHDEIFRNYNRPKRTPHSPNLWAKSSESQGVSCPTRLRENSLDSLGGSDMTKEAVHISCPKRKSSGAKVVASFRGKSPKDAERSHKCNRGARELFKKTFAGRSVKPNVQWMVLPSQDRAQNPNGGDLNTNTMKLDPIPKWSSMKQSPLQSHRGMETQERSMMRNSKEPKVCSKEEPTPHSADSKLKPKFQALPEELKMPKLPEPVHPGRQLLSAPSNQEYYRLGTTLQPYRNLQIQVPQMVHNQGPNRPPQNPYDLSRFLMYDYNATYDGPHRRPQPDDHQGSSSPGHPAYTNTAKNEQRPPHYPTPVSPANAIQMYTLVFNASMPPTMLPSTTESRNGPWAPGTVEVEIPPGYPHQPKLPKFTTKSFDAVNFKDLPKFEEKTFELSQPFPNGPPPNSWKYSGPSQNYQPNLMVESAQPISSYSNYNPGVTPFLEKTSHAFKNVFGKLKKEESKVKLAKPGKPPMGYAHPRAPPMDKHWESGIVKSEVRPAEPAHLLAQPELRSRIQQPMIKNEMSQAGPEAKFPHVLPPLRQVSRDRSPANDRGNQRYNSVDRAYILNPPATMDPNLFTNKAHKIASKVVSSEDITYTPFRGYPPARNDEAFYDKNMKFMGKIDRPPLVNIKKQKWSRLDRKFTDDGAYKRMDNLPDRFYSQPVDFHSDVAGDMDSERIPKCVHHHHHSRHNNHNRGALWQPLNTQERTRA